MPSRRAILLLLLLAAPAAAQQDTFAKDVKAFIDRHCVSCHNDKKKQGDLDIARFKTAADVKAALPLWEQIAARTRAHEMPPEKARQPSIDARGKFLAWVDGATRKKDDECKQLATDQTQSFYPGHVMSRRLNRAEYDNTTRDLFGLDFRLGERLPQDGAGGEGFDTNGDSLFTSAIHVEKYFAVAETILRVVLRTGKAAVDVKAFPAADVEAARRRLLLATPSATVSARDAAAKIVKAFVTRAWRRPVGDAEVARLLSVFEKALARGDSFEAALKLPLKAALVSPHFLFLVEPEPAKEGVYKLGDYPLASRLSYFVWASMPDDELFALAAKGELQDTETLRKQVVRMLASPKARGFAENFSSQWLGLRALGETVRPDPKRFPDFDDALAADMKAEAVSLVEHVFRENRSLRELLDADYTFVNARLAKHYGLADVDGDHFRKVTLKDRTRGGVLSMAGVLTVTSYPLRTSPVLRGRWILEDILGSKVPPPPPNAGELSADGKSPKGLSLRQQLELHRTRPDCASCHKRMDPLGFGLDNFDPVGRYRTLDDGKPIDATGVLPSGEKFDGVVGLKDILKKRTPEFSRHLARKMTGYALGRQLHRHDQCVIDEAMKALAANDFRAATLVEKIVLSYPFRHRYVKK